MFEHFCVRHHTVGHHVKEKLLYSVVFIEKSQFWNVHIYVDLQMKRRTMNISYEDNLTGTFVTWGWALPR